MKAGKLLSIVAVTVCCAVLLGCTTTPNTGGGPGHRPRHYRVGFFKSKDRQLRDAAWDLKVFEERRQAAPDVQPYYSTVIRTKKDWQDLIDAQREKVKNLLAQDTARTPRAVQTGLGQGSNKEALELFNSFVNLEQFVVAGRADLANSSKGSAAARKYYWAHWKAIEMMYEMHNTFVNRCGSAYRPALGRLQSRTEELARRNRALAAEVSAGPTQEALARTAERPEKIADQVKLALPVLDQQQEWARAKLPVLKEQIVAARQAYEAAELGAQASGLVGAVSTAFQELQSEPPPLILFDVPADEFAEAPAD